MDGPYQCEAVVREDLGAGLRARDVDTAHVGRRELHDGAATPAQSRGGRSQGGVEARGPAGDDPRHDALPPVSEVAHDRSDARRRKRVDLVVAQRRVALMVDPTLSFDLPPFLTPTPGLNSGLMIAEVTTAALMSENKHLATPCSTDSTPTSANQEDHVSMAAHGAMRLGRMNRNLAHIVAVEALCAAQGIEFRAAAWCDRQHERHGTL